MKKTILFIIPILFCTLYACRPTKKAQKVQKQIERKDTSKIVIVTSETQSSDLDSLRQTLAFLDSNRIMGFQTFNGKAKIDMDNQPNVTANIHIKEDSIIWVSVTAILGIEAMRIKITPDSLLIMNRLKHTVTRRSINFLEDFLKVPLTFNDVQNIILGNPVFMQGNITSYKHLHNKWFVNISKNALTNFVMIIDKDKKFYIRHCRIQDSTASHNRICDITYNAQEQINNYWFSQNRIVSVSDNATQVQLKMQFKDFKFSQSIEFPFNIPDSYEEK